MRGGPLGGVAPCLLVKRLGRQVDAVRPCHGPGLWIDAGFREIGGIAQWLEHASPFVIREVDVADGAVGEGESQHVVGDHCDCGDVDESLHAEMQRERIDLLERATVASAGPAGLQLVTVEACPFGDESARAGRLPAIG